jgi:hypothetical protein
MTQDKTILDEKTILQINATIITGILILLTISNIAGKTDYIKYLVGYVGFILIPYCASSLAVIIVNMRIEKSARFVSLMAMVFGLVLIPSVVVLYVSIPIVFPNIHFPSPYPRVS